MRLHVLHLEKIYELGFAATTLELHGAVND
jgi:hypothetical protein